MPTTMIDAQDQILVPGPSDEAHPLGAPAHPAASIALWDFHTVPMRTFHLTWMSLFLCFFAWFGVAPFMPVIRSDLGLTDVQVANTAIASVVGTVFARMFIGVMCDRFGPRRTYALLLFLGAIPTAGLVVVSSYETFLLARFLIGGLGASFVITQYHTSVMFQDRCVGTANATTAGWGNLGGGVTQVVMPLVGAGIVALGFSRSASWRLAMLVPAVLLAGAGVAYLRFTKDLPGGNLSEVPKSAAASLSPTIPVSRPWGSLRDMRVWVLALVYGGCFGVEVTVLNFAATHFHDDYRLSIGAAGMAVAVFGFLNVFGRPLGGFLTDRIGGRWGQRGRARLLAGLLVFEGLFLWGFSMVPRGSMALAVLVLLGFGLFVQLAEGATFGIVPLLHRVGLGRVVGLVSTGGILGAVGAGFLFRVEGSLASSFGALGIIVACVSWTPMLLRFPEEKGAVG